MRKELKSYYKFEYAECVFKNKVIYEKGQLEICKNGITLIVGENGTGKSTLLGRLFQNQNSNGTYICQDNYEIFKKLSILQNITFFQPEIDEKKLIQILGKYHVDGLLDKKADCLSGGEKRIITILRGIMSEEELVFLDEPTNDLDYQTVDIIVQMLNDYKNKKTFLVVTHDERLYPISDCIYEILNKQVVVRESKIIMEHECVLENPGKSKVFQDKVFINKVFSFNFCGIICLFLLALLSVYMFYYLKRETNEKIDRINANQVEICNSIYSEPMKLVNEGFVPTSFLAYLNSDISLNELSSALERGIKNNEDRFYCLNLHIDNSMDYQVYNMYRYDLSTTTLLNTLDFCKPENKDFFKKDYYIDTSKYFKHDTTYKNGIRVEFNDTMYQNAIKDMDSKYEEKLENILIEVKLNEGYSFYNFMSQKKYKEKWKSNYFIRSNETIEIVQNARNLIKFKKIIKLWLCGATLLIFIILYHTVINWFIIKKKIIILKNYGFCKADIKRAVFHKYNNRKYYFGVFIISEAAMALMYFYYRDVKEVKEYIIMILLGMFILLTKRIQKGIYDINISHLYKIKGEF